MLSNITGPYVESEGYTRHGNEFENRQFFIGGPVVPQDRMAPALRYFTERRDLLTGIPQRRKQHNNREVLLGRLFTLTESMKLSFQMGFKVGDAKLAAQIVVAALTYAYLKTFEDIGHMAVIRRGSGGKHLVLATAQKHVTIHLVGYKGGFDPHIHEVGNDIGYDASDKPGTIKREVEFFQNAHIQKAFQMHLADYCRSVLGWNVVIENGKAVVPHLTHKMCLDAGIGQRRLEILKWCEDKGIIPTRVATLIANYATREKPAKVYTLAERAPAWSLGIDRMLMEQQRLTGQKVSMPGPSPAMGAKPKTSGSTERFVEWARSRIARVMQKTHWLWLRMKHNGRETYRLDSREQLQRLLADTRKRHFSFARNAAIRAFSKPHFGPVEKAIRRAEFAYAATRAPAFTPTAKNRFILSKKLVAELSVAEFKALNAIEVRTGCKITYAGGLPDRLHKHRLEKTRTFEQGPTRQY